MCQLVGWGWHGDRGGASLGGELASDCRLPSPLALHQGHEAARAEARRLGLRIRGTLGTLVLAYRQKLLTFDRFEILLQEIAARPDIWISASLCEQVLASVRSPLD